MKRKLLTVIEWLMICIAAGSISYTITTALISCEPIHSVIAAQP